MPAATAMPTSSQAPQLIDTARGPPASVMLTASASRKLLAAE